MLSKKAIVIVLILFFVVCDSFAREATISFFGKSVTRRYYQNEFFNILSYKDINFKYSYASLRVESVNFSKSIKLRISKVKTYFFNKKIDVLLLKFKIGANKGAIEINTSIPVPNWCNTLRLWILNHYSQMEGYIYISYPGRLVRYKIGCINHVKWKTFNIRIEKRAKGVIRRIKFFNKAKRTNIYFDNTIAIASKIMFMSKYKDDNRTEYVREINPTDLIGSRTKKGILKVITNGPSYYRFKRGFMVSKDEFIILSLDANSPYILEIIGGLVTNKRKLFVLYLNVDPRRRKHFLIIKLPNDLYRRFGGVLVFWGIGVAPIKDRIDVTIKSIKISSDI